MQPMKRIVEQYREAKTIIDPEKVIYIALQGSQNYNLEYEDSDIDSKVIVTPDLRDVVENRKPVSTTHVCDNAEHIDLKDIRLMFDCFKKQNINFIEILFTDYHIIQSNYYKEVIELRDNAENIARYNPYRAVKCIKGMAKEKFHALNNKGVNLKYTEHNTFKSDVFSLGLCFLLAATLTFNSLVDIRELTDMTSLKMVVGRYLKPRYSNAFIDVIDRMLEINEKDRCDFIELNTIVDNL